MIDLLGSITRHAVSRLILGHVGERTASGKRMGPRSLKSETQSEDERIDGSAMWRAWRMTGMLSGCMLVGRGRGVWIP